MLPRFVRGSGIEMIDYTEPIDRIVFLDWLRVTAGLDKFFRNCHHMCINWPTGESEKETPISCSFIWSKTEEGFVYWATLNNEWKKFLKSTAVETADLTLIKGGQDDTWT